MKAQITKQMPDTMPWPDAVHIGSIIVDVFKISDGIYYARVTDNYCAVVDFVTLGLYYVGDERQLHELKCHSHVDISMADGHETPDYMTGLLDGVPVRNYVFCDETDVIFVSQDHCWITIRPRTDRTW